MKRTITFAFVLALAALTAGPAAATKHRVHHTGVTCQRIKDAIAAGKTSDEVEKDMHTTAARVKQCTTPAPAHAKQQAEPAPAK
jgi:hypothetical protein